MLLKSNTMVTVHNEHVKCKGIFATVHAMTAYRGSGGIIPLLLNLSTRRKQSSTYRPGRIIPRKEPRYAMRRLGRPPQPFWTSWIRENIFLLPRFESTTVQTVA